MEEYLIKDYDAKAVKGTEERPHLRVVVGKEVWEVVEEAKRESKKIAIYLLGDCVLDWS